MQGINPASAREDFPTSGRTNQGEETLFLRCAEVVLSAMAALALEPGLAYAAGYGGMPIRRWSFFHAYRCSDLYVL
jgi:hypothetical protein